MANLCKLAKRYDEDDKAANLADTGAENENEATMDVFGPKPLYGQKNGHSGDLGKYAELSQKILEAEKQVKRRKDAHQDLQGWDKALKRLRLEQLRMEVSGRGE